MSSSDPFQRLANPYADEAADDPGRSARLAGRALTVGALGLGAAAVFTGTGLAAEGDAAPSDDFSAMMADAQDLMSSASAASGGGGPESVATVEQDLIAGALAAQGESSPPAPTSTDQPGLVLFGQPDVNPSELYGPPAPGATPAVEQSVPSGPTPEEAGRMVAEAQAFAATLGVPSTPVEPPVPVVTPAVEQPVPSGPTPEEASRMVADAQAIAATLGVPPTPAPEPVSVPTPAPEPVSVPTPAPEPVSVPTPAPEPVSVPTPAPEPVPVPTPAPEPVPVPTPAPEPVSVPTPAPEPVPVPASTPMDIAAPSAAPAERSASQFSGSGFGGGGSNWWPSTPTMHSLPSNIVDVPASNLRILDTGPTTTERFLDTRPQFTPQFTPQQPDFRQQQVAPTSLPPVTPAGGVVSPNNPYGFTQDQIMAAFGSHDAQDRVSRGGLDNYSPPSLAQIAASPNQPGNGGNTAQPQNFGQNAPQNFGQNAPQNFGQNAPQNFGQNAQLSGGSGSSNVFGGSGSDQLVAQTPIGGNQFTGATNFSIGQQPIANPSPVFGGSMNPGPNNGGQVNPVYGNASSIGPLYPVGIPVNVPNNGGGQGTDSSSRLTVNPQVTGIAPLYPTNSYIPVAPTVVIPGQTIGATSNASIVGNSAVGLNFKGTGSTTPNPAGNGFINGQPNPYSVQTGLNLNGQIPLGGNSGIAGRIGVNATGSGGGGQPATTGVPTFGGSVTGVIGGAPLPENGFGVNGNVTGTVGFTNPIGQPTAPSSTFGTVQGNLNVGNETNNAGIFGRVGTTTWSLGEQSQVSNQAGGGLNFQAGNSSIQPYVDFKGIGGAAPSTTFGVNFNTSF